MFRATAFVLPSTFEACGVVLQEAAAAALPLIASHACGALVHLLRTGFNGLAFETGDVAGLSDALLAMHDATAAELAATGISSSHLAQQNSSSIWANTLSKGITMLQKKETGSVNLAFLWSPRERC